MNLSSNIAEIMTNEFDVPSKHARKASESFLKMFRKCVENPKMSLDQWRLLLWINALGEDYEELADLIYLRWKTLRYRNLKVPDAVISFLKLLRKQYQLCLLTNGPSNSQWEKVRELDLEHLFDAVVVSGDSKFEKPQPEIFHEVCTLLGVEPFECLMVGDSLETGQITLLDIEGGLVAQVGLTVWLNINQGEIDLKTIHPQPDLIIKDILELRGILEGKTSKASLSLKRRNSNSTPSAGSGHSGSVVFSQGRKFSADKGNDD